MTKFKRDEIDEIRKFVSLYVSGSVERAYRMKKFYSWKQCAFIFSAFVIAGEVYSHGGGLNAEGCHNNRKTGDHHCHRGDSNPKSLLQISTEFNSVYEQQNTALIGSFNRDLYGYESYPSSATRGFYTGQTCNTNIDHVVSLKDAHESGAGRWTIAERVTFSNDRLNHVPACSRINSSKGASTPSDFFRKSSDGKGMEYEIKPRCAYLGIYYQVKKQYRLSFGNNDPKIFFDCGLVVP